MEAERPPAVSQAPLLVGRLMLWQKDSLLAPSYSCVFLVHLSLPRDIVPLGYIGIQKKSIR